ncbi:MAG: SulP family inorganic anion transporter [Polyangiales bacterium]
MSSERSPAVRGRPQPPPRGVRRYLPFLGWLPSYRREDLPGDVAAGLTTAVMLIPQGMAYAMLAGMPPIYGLYASVVPLAIYALLGTSRQLAVGPVAMVSLLTLQGVSTLAEPSSEAFVGYAIGLALVVGVMQVGMGFFRLGFLVNFLSHPVISGFTSAAALIIGTSQLKQVIGVDLPKSSNIFATFGEAFSRFSEWHLLTLAIALGSVVMLEVLKRWKKTFPRALAVVVVGTLAVWGLGLDAQGVAVVRNVPAGFPTPTLPSLDLEALKGLLPTAIAISLVGFMESVSVAKAFARKNKYEIEPSQELVGLGAANVAGAFFGAFPVTGGFSRTAVNAEAGARTPLASLITAFVIAIALLFLTPLFYFLPKAVLAAIILNAVAGLVDVHEVKHLEGEEGRPRDPHDHLRGDARARHRRGYPRRRRRLARGVHRPDHASTRRGARAPSRHRGYRNLKNYAEAEPTSGILALRIDAQFYFGNVTFLKDTLRNLQSR